MGGTAATTPAAPAASQPAQQQSEPMRIYNELVTSMRSLTAINLQEPILTATTYTTPMQAIKPVRQPNQRIIVKPKGSYSI